KRQFPLNVFAARLQLQQHAVRYAATGIVQLAAQVINRLPGETAFEVAQADEERNPSDDKPEIATDRRADAGAQNAPVRETEVAADQAAPDETPELKQIEDGEHARKRLDFVRPSMIPARRVRRDLMGQSRPRTCGGERESRGSIRRGPVASAMTQPRV